MTFFRLSLSIYKKLQTKLRDAYFAVCGIPVVPVVSEIGPYKTFHGLMEHPDNFGVS
jgi:hypothetical protein